MKKRSYLNFFIFAFLAVTVFYPLAVMVSKVSWENFNSLVASNAFKDALSNSLFVTSISTIISIIIAYLLALTINRANIKHKTIIKVLITLPMLIPSISHGLGLINLFGNNGIISSHFNFNVIGPVGIIIGSIVYSFPVAFLMLDDGFNYIDNSMYYNAKILGMNKFQTFKNVTFCYMKKPIFSSIFAVFTMIFTDYGVPLAVGGTFITLPVFLYKEVIGLLDFSKGTMIGLFLLIPALVSFLFDTFSKDFAKNDGTDDSEMKIENKYVRILLKTFMVIIILMLFVLIGSFVYYAFVDNPILNKTFSLSHLEYIIGDDFFAYFGNSIFISIFVSIIGTTIAYFTAYVTARRKSKLTKIVHILSIATLAVPGIVLGLSFTVAFKTSFIYNTFIILILVNIIHFFASPYLIAYNALQKVNENFEIVGKTFNISTFKIIKDVIIPCTKKTIREMFSYFFINSMITISAVSFLFSTNTMPVSLLINVYEDNLMLGEAAFVSLFILLCNVLMKFIMYLLNVIDRRRYKYGTNI